MVQGVSQLGSLRPSICTCAPSGVESIASWPGIAAGAGAAFLLLPLRAFAFLAGTPRTGSAGAGSSGASAWAAGGSAVTDSTGAGGCTGGGAAVTGAAASAGTRPSSSVLCDCERQYTSPHTSTIRATAAEIEYSISLGGRLLSSCTAFSATSRGWILGFSGCVGRSTMEGRGSPASGSWLFGAGGGV